jgi:hypothetical protein
LQKAIGRDVLHQKTHFVHVPRHHHPRSFAALTKHRSTVVGAQFAMTLQFIDKNRPHLRALKMDYPKPTWDPKSVIID